MPMGAPGWPELDLKVVSTWEDCQHVYVDGDGAGGALLLLRVEGQHGRLSPSIEVSQQTYRKSADGVDGEGVDLVVAHLCGIFRWICRKG